MSREDVRLEGYEPGNGFQPADFGFSLRDFRKALPFVATYVLIALLRSYLGNRAAIILLGGVMGALFLAVGIRDILRAERFEVGRTETGARRIRIGGIVEVVFGTAGATASILFLWEEW